MNDHDTELCYSKKKQNEIYNPEYSALSEAIVKLTGEGMGKIVNNPKAIKERSKPTNLTSKNAW